MRRQGGEFEVTVACDVRGLECSLGDCHTHLSQSFSLGERSKVTGRGNKCCFTGNLQFLLIKTTKSSGPESGLERGFLSAL